MMKLGPHYLPGGENDTARWLRELKPAVAKFCYQFDISVAADPQTFTVGRPDENFIGSAHPLGEGDPVALAREFTASVYEPLIRARGNIKGWEGPNEINMGLDEADKMIWYTAFLAEFARCVSLLGRQALIGSWAVGTPEFGLWRHYAPALRATQHYGAILSRHSYGPLDQWYSFRHREDEKYFRELGFINTPVIITECGADRLGDQRGRFRDLWGTNLTAYWTDYLRLFEIGIQQDNYVKGATLYTVGTGFSPAWVPFDVCGLQPDIVSVVRANPAPTPPMPIPPADDTTHFVTAQVLNVRMYPWCGEAKPPVLRQLFYGNKVRSLGVVKTASMLYGWHLIQGMTGKCDGNEWVSGQYLKPVEA